jgi:hypothetical protein
MISFADHPGGGPGQDPSPRRATAQKSSIDSANHFEVVERKSGAGVIILNPPKPDQVLDKKQCVNLAAWLVAMSGATGDDFVQVLTDIAKK